MQAMKRLVHAMSLTPCPEQSCEMTYMSPRYLPFDNSGHLYRFVDMRMPQDLGVPHTDCRMVLLFIPGHAGSHEQVRSIGAETLRAAAAKHVSVHVFTVSLGEGLSAFDGAVLREHSARVEAALISISRQYRQQPAPPDLFLVAHSMGGVATLDALLRMRRTRRSEAPASLLSVDAILLLGVPLQRPVLDCSSSLSKLYRRVHRSLSRRGKEEDGDGHGLEGLPAFAAIWGGCRDRIVPAALSSLDGVVPRRAIALNLTSQVLPGVHTPIDHAALLWCNQLVRRVASAIVATAALRQQFAPSASTSSTASAVAAPSASGSSSPLPLDSRVAAVRAALIAADSGPTATPPSSLVAETSLRSDPLTCTPADGGDSMDPTTLEELLADPIRLVLDAACATLLLLLACPLTASTCAQPAKSTRAARAVSWQLHGAAWLATGLAGGWLMNAAAVWVSRRWLNSADEGGGGCEGSDATDSDGSCAGSGGRGECWLSINARDALLILPPLPLLFARLAASLLLAGVLDVVSRCLAWASAKAGAARLSTLPSEPPGVCRRWRRCLSSWQLHAHTCLGAAHVIGSVTHPALGLLLGACVPLGRAAGRGTGTGTWTETGAGRLHACAFAALAPGVAAWWRRAACELSTVYERRAIGYSSDARWALAHTTLILLGSSLMATASGPSSVGSRDSSRSAAATVRLGAAMAVVACALSGGPDGCGDGGDAASKTEAVLRLATLGTALLMRW